MALQRVPINNFRGGLNVRDSPFELQPNESPDLLNVTISALVGQLESRKGKTRIDVSGMPNEEANFAKQVVIGANKRYLMMSINGGIWYMNSAGEVKKLFAGTAGAIWDFEVYSDAAFKDWVYCGNGVDAMQKWDGEAAATVEWKATKGSIPKGGVLCVWENRMFITYVSANVQRIYFSEFGDPEATIKEYGFLDVRGPEEDLDAIQDLAVLGARLFVFKRRSVSYVSSSVTLANRRIGSPGVWSRFQVQELEDKLYFFNPQGLFSTAGVAVTMESGSITNYFPEKLSAAHADKVRLMATRDTYPRLLLTLPIEASTTNNILIEMVPHINFRRIGGRRYLLLPAFMLHTFVASSLSTWNPTGAEEIIVGTIPGKVSRLFHGTTDEGTEIESHWHSSWMAIQGEEPKERVRRLNVELQGDAIVDVYKDFEETVAFTAVLPKTEPGHESEEDVLWEGGKWEGGIWGEPQAYRFCRVRPETHGRFHAIRFRSLKGGKPFLINVAELVIRGGKEH